MEDYKDIKAIWEGKLLLDRIKWRKISYKEFQLSDKHRTEIRKNWDNHIGANPNDYDGKLIFLDGFQFKNNYIYLDVRLIRFSTIIYMVRKRIPVKTGIGMLGTQCLIFSPNKKYTLIGKRSLSEIYYPGAIINVGGMLELNDLERTPKDALMREVYEEIQIPLEFDASLNAILVGWNKISVTFLTSTMAHSAYDFNPENEVFPTDKNEFEGNLFWIPVEDLKNMEPNHLFDGLNYYRSKLINSC